MSNHFIANSTENIFHLSGFWGSFGYFLRLENGKDYLITDGRYAEQAQKLAPEFVLFDADFSEKFGKHITDQINCEDSLTLSGLKKLRKLFPNATFEPQENLINRRVKTADEISKIKIAQNHVDETLLPFLKENLKVGVTEQALNFKLQQVLQAEGKFGLSFPSIIAFGENSSRPHHVSTSRQLKWGDNILIDCGVTYGHYCSDMTRNFVFGDPDPEFVEKYQQLLNVQQATNLKITAGASTQAVDKFCRDQLGDQAEYFCHSLGHGVGLEIHELPNLSPRQGYTLQENEVVTCEPGLYYPGEFGIRIEDLLIVRTGKPTVLSHTAKDLLSLDEVGQVKMLVKSG